MGEGGALDMGSAPPLGTSSGSAPAPPPQSLANSLSMIQVIIFCRSVERLYKHIFVKLFRYG